MFTINNYGVYLSLFFIIFLLYIFIKFTLNKKNSIFFIGMQFYFVTIILIINICFNIFEENIISSIVWTLLPILPLLNDMLCVAITPTCIKSLFSKYNYTDIESITIKNFPDQYTKKMLVTINLKNQKHKSCKFPYTETLIPTLLGTGLPVENNYKKVNEL